MRKVAENCHQKPNSSLSSQKSNIFCAGKITFYRSVERILSKPVDEKPLSLQWDFGQSHVIEQNVDEAYLMSSYAAYSERSQTRLEGPSPRQAQANPCIRLSLFGPGWAWLRAWGPARYNTNSNNDATRCDTYLMDRLLQHRFGMTND